MKAAELMIGDWLRYSPKSISLNNNYGGQYRVEGVSQDTISLGAKNYRFVVSDKEIDSIPLTSEILEKNGWWFDVEDTWWHNEVNFTIEKWNGRFQCYDINQIKLNSVHELQHALRLCGLDELADNFKI